MNLETRSYEIDLEVRGEGDGRTVCGICVPYDVEQRIHPTLTEVFRRGAFANVARARTHERPRDDRDAIGAVHIKWNST